LTRLALVAVEALVEEDVLQSSIVSSFLVNLPRGGIVKHKTRQDPSVSHFQRREYKACPPGMEVMFQEAGNGITKRR
jgi:hypothetical protein